MKSSPLPTRLTLVSHASTAALRRGAFPLDEDLIQGESERVSSIGWIAPRAQNVWCGPEQRTRQTAAALGLHPFEISELADIDSGQWGGKELDEVQASDPDGLAEWLTNPEAAPHGGESLVQLFERVDLWMKGLIGTGHTLAITHPAIIRAAIVSSLKSPVSSFWRIEISPLSATDLRFNGRNWTVRALGCPL